MSGDTGNDPAAFKSSSGLLWGRGETGDRLVSTALLHLLCQTWARAYFTQMNCWQTQAETKKPRMMQTSWRSQIPADEAALPGMFSEWSWCPGTDSQLLTDSYTVATAAERGSKVTLRQLLRTLCCSHKLTRIYVQSQLSGLDPHLYPSLIPVLQSRPIFTMPAMVSKVLPATIIILPLSPHWWFIQ